MSAANAWVAERWLDADPRYAGSLRVCVTDVPSALTEIERWAGDPRFVQLVVPLRAFQPYGDEGYFPIWQAAVEHDLPVAIFDDDATVVEHHETPVGALRYFSEKHALRPFAGIVHLASARHLRRLRPPAEPQGRGRRRLGRRRAADAVARRPRLAPGPRRDPVGREAAQQLPARPRALRHPGRGRRARRVPRPRGPHPHRRRRAPAGLRQPLAVLGPARAEPPCWKAGPTTCAPGSWSATRWTSCRGLRRWLRSGCRRASGSAPAAP